MSSCSKRCKLGFVKFAQTIFKLITGTLSKGLRNVKVLSDQAHHSLIRFAGQVLSGVPVIPYQRGRRKLGPPPPAKPVPLWGLWARLPDDTNTRQE
ncbi:hypothetical protein CB1_000916019 [Camelus ferus]|nr:hypothetical protein CB1_000916019 [Camelus ferus]